MWLLEGAEILYGACVTKDEKTSELIRIAVKTLKNHAAPATLNEPASIKAYYAALETPVEWKPGTRTPLEIVLPGTKMKSRFRGSYQN